MCLASCNLGCSGNTCAVSNIAQNQNIVLVFSKNVDPLWANASTIQFRTASGDQPVGEFFVNGTVVEFRPQVLIVGGQSFFGFQANETYTMTLPGGVNEPNALRSTSGTRLGSTTTCTLHVTRGIVDLNGVPPSANLISPTTTSNVPKDVVIALEFNEIIDNTPFVGTNASNGPIQYSLRQTTSSGGALICNPSANSSRALPGAPQLTNDPVRQVTTVTFRPTSLLPGNMCVEVFISDRVRDLAGVPARPAVFQFTTVTQTQTEVQVPPGGEQFLDDTNLDHDRSSGTWENGLGTFGMIGGDGHDGEFAAELGVDLGVINGRRTFQFNTDDTTIPSTNTINQLPDHITDGRFYFSQMIVPGDVRLRFVGSSPPQFNVRGKIDISGVIEVNGESLPYYLPATTTNVGQTGSAGAGLGGKGGIFGGAGGKGANRCLGTGPSLNFVGGNGQDVQVLAGHAYAGNTGGTGGQGSPLFPASGLNAGVVFASGVLTYALQVTSGGGGGGYAAVGSQGHSVSNNVPDPISGVPPRQDFLGPPAAGGAAFQLFPVPAGMRSSLHFLVGGSGGGGGGSQPTMANNFQVSSIGTNFAPGSAGGGGGGAIAFRAGDQFRLAATAQVVAFGGSAGSSLSGAVASALPSVAGGGSGGSVLIQTGRLVDAAGLIDVRGGAGGVFDRTSPGITTPPQGGNVRTVGGDGAPGFARLEVPANPSPALLPGAQPPIPANDTTHVALLAENDLRAGFQSLFYNTGQPFGPQYARYVIQATVDGQAMTFSDDPAVSATPAAFGSAPIQAYFQGANSDPTTGIIDPSSIRDWHPQVGPFNGQPSLADDATTSFRFMILLDRSVNAQVVITNVTVIYRI
jgi:hypothetical protein